MPLPTSLQEKDRHSIRSKCGLTLSGRSFETRATAATIFEKPETKIFIKGQIFRKRNRKPTLEGHKPLEKICILSFSQNE